MAEKRKVTNLLGLAVLAYLSRGPMHPYELSRTLRDNDDTRSIRFTHGSLYSVVRQLARAGYIVETETVRDSRRPERTLYAITEAGKRELHDWLRDLVETPVEEYPHFLAALSLIAAIPPGEAVSLLATRVARLEQRRDENRALVDATLAKGVHPLFLVEEDYRLAMIEAEIAFIERLIRRITDPDTGWERAWAAFHEGAAQAQETERRNA